jgi:hypothetical protein
MGTFHQGKHELHGITIVVETDGPETHIGRCDDIVERGVILLDGDTHRESPLGPSKAEYLKKAAMFGVFKSFDTLIVDPARVVGIRRLGDL